ncbi:MAG: CBS domain-containing protein [Thermoplasmata archaeon]|nr:CBS domain-containing protein [Thermoplasmata archaeon]
MHEFLEKSVEEIMNSRIWDLPIVERSASIKVVLVVLIGRCYAWVVNSMADMKPVGIITEHDALKLIDGYKEGMKAEDIMSPNLTIAHPDEKVKDILDKMNSRGYRRIPVVSNEKLIGEITLRHLIERLYSALF